jgi:tetratricopeptide (TPR) repeat protein
MQIRGRYELAAQCCTNGLQWDTESHILHSNRSAAHFSAERYPEAVVDAQRCTEIKPVFAKGYFRKAKALEKLGRIEEAAKAIAQALEANCSEKEKKKFEKLLAKLLKHQ